VREASTSRPTAPSEASASPRKPKLWIARRSLPSIFEVACRDSASGKSSARMPWPSSKTRISVLPPSACATSIRRAPASSAFSTSSFTAEAGRSTTSPAAIRLMTDSPSCTILGGSVSIWGIGAFMPQHLA
jgi:hypothetical protein